MYATAEGLLCVLLTLPFVSTQITNNAIIPKDIIFGVATSAYQVEGAWNIDGKGESIWDNFTHRIPSPIINGDKADGACDSYYKYKEDLRLAAGLGVKIYRFSISWPRILPTGYANQINQKGLMYYRNLVKEIKKNKMLAVATIYHWDLPQRLLNDGIHWTNSSIIPHIVNYARVVIRNLPDVDIWITLNEPKQICHLGYGMGIMAPGIKSSGLLEYQCSYNVLKAHASIYHMYKKEFPQYKAKMSIIIDCQWIESSSNNPEDEMAAERQRQFECGLYFHPIFKGDWPELVKSKIYNRSIAAGMKKSRLPAFTKEEISFLNGTHDFLGLNHYSTMLASNVREAPVNETSYDNDQGITDSYDPSWHMESNNYFANVPFGMKKVLLWLKEQYGNVNVMITEVGMCDNGTLNDIERKTFYNNYFCTMLEAINQGVNVTAVILWSLMDNFEWSYGYSARFGLYYIDFKDPYRKRVPKESVRFIQEFMKTRKVLCEKASKSVSVSKKSGKT